MRNKVAVMAGTPVDTKMGADFLAARDPSLELVSYPVSKDPIEQTMWQFSSEENKRARMVEVFDELEAQGIRDFFIYCNSMSGAFDFDSFAVDGEVLYIAKRDGEGKQNFNAYDMSSGVELQILLPRFEEHYPGEYGYDENWRRGVN